MMQNTSIEQPSTARNIELYEQFVALLEKMTSLKVVKSKTDSIARARKLQTELREVQKSMNDIVRELVVSFTDFAHVNKEAFPYNRQYDLCGYKTNRYVGYASAAPKLKSKCGSLVAMMSHDHGEGNYSKSGLVIPRDFIFDPESYLRRTELDTISRRVATCQADVKKSEEELEQKKENLKTLEKKLASLKQE